MGDDDPGLDKLLAHLKTSRGFDFTGYKRPSLARRVRRRMESVGIDSYETYLDRLELDATEFTALFNTILINVTGFNRDADAWEQLATTWLPRLLARPPAHQLRVWSAGCASGQEAYSLAIAAAETVGLDRLRERVKIFATDVDEEALAQARSASYSDRELSGLGAELTERYTEPAGERRAIRPEIRRAVIFGRNDLVQDSPISRIDLLLCRNTLMYLNAETQARVLSRLHFALRPHGLLFLGKAEMLLSHTTLFTAVDPKRRFFRRATVDDHSFRGGHGAAAPGASSTGAVATDDALGRAALRAAPTAEVVLDAAGRLATANDRARQLLGLAGGLVGTPFQDLDVSYRPVDLRSAVERAGERHDTVVVRGVRLERDGSTTTLDVHAVPLYGDDGARLGTALAFEDVSTSVGLREELSHATVRLDAAYGELQSSTEELETTTEELQSTVEELETTNEELQSTNEELETTNEELQSMNDELQSTNSELRAAATEVDELNAFMEAVLAGLRDGIAVTDQHLVVTAWNRRAEDLWGVRAGEAVGTPLFDVDIGLPVEDLRGVVEAQLAGAGGPHEGIEVAAVNRRGRSVRVRVGVSPLRRGDGGPAGVIMLMDALD